MAQKNGSRMLAHANRLNSGGTQHDEQDKISDASGVSSEASRRLKQQSSETSRRVQQQPAAR